MCNGVNGVAHQKLFRPTHILVEFDVLGVAETRIYGLGVKEDGTVGQRELDHRWYRGSKTTNLSWSDSTDDVPT